jgi:hypothetical protein
MRTFTVQYQPLGLRSKLSVQGSSTLNDPVESRVTTIGFATIVALFSSSRRLEAVKTKLPEAAAPVLFKYLPTTFLVLTSGEKLIRSAPGHENYRD